MEEQRRGAEEESETPMGVGVLTKLGPVEAEVVGLATHRSRPAASSTMCVPWWSSSSMEEGGCGTESKKLMWQKNTEPICERVLTWPIVSKPTAVDGAPLMSINSRV